MKKQTKCYLYTRVSTAMQVDGYSLDAQRDKLRKYAAYEDMTIAGEYSDSGFSGKNIQDGTASVFPVRAPSLRMVDQGYACIDKSNFLSDALRSGQILAETVLQYGVSLPDLWRYQVRYYHQVVASSFYLQGVKYSLFTTDPKTLASAYEDNLLTDAMLQLIASRTRTPVGNDRLMPSFGRLLRKPLFSARLAKANAAGESPSNGMQRLIRPGNRPCWKN